jgi:hypothetical protein
MVGDGMNGFARLAADPTVDQHRRLLARLN